MAGSVKPGGMAQLSDLDAVTIGTEAGPSANRL